MEIQLTLGFSVDVDEAGRFELPNDRTYSASELNRIAREINRKMRQMATEQLLGGNEDEAIY